MKGGRAGGETVPLALASPLAPASPAPRVYTPLGTVVILAPSGGETVEADGWLEKVVRLMVAPLALTWSITPDELAAQ